jgi:hypothetical protein
MGINPLKLHLLDEYIPVTVRVGYWYPPMIYSTRVSIRLCAAFSSINQSINHDCLYVRT